MKRFKNILVVLSETPADDRVLERAKELAAANGARLTVKAVVYRPPNTFGKLAGQELQEDFAQQVTQKQQARLNAIKTQAAEYAERVSVGPLPEQDTFIAIIKSVLQEEHDLVMMADDAPHSLREKFFGTTVSHLLRKCPCPVWAFKPTERSGVPARFPRILAAVDTMVLEEEDDDEKNALNRKIMELATSLAKLEGAELHVIHCWYAYGESLITDREGRDGPELKRYLRETRATHRKHFGELLASFADRGVAFTSHMPKGDAGLKIPEFATREKINLVVMGTLTRSRIRGLLIGSTAEQVLQRLGCSLLAVKPDGFVSPVT